jgi:hypothetical protein
VQLAEGLSRTARHSWEGALALLAKIPGADASEATFRLACQAAAAKPAAMSCPNDAVKLHSAVSYVRWKRC